jgi:hypothetical protein
VPRGIPTTCNREFLSDLTANLQKPLGIFEFANVRLYVLLQFCVLANINYEHTPQCEKSSHLII